MAIWMLGTRRDCERNDHGGENDSYELVHIRPPLKL
jgi:hypothetical protein